jgi:primosomal protein N' (replication factor Y)
VFDLPLDRRFTYRVPDALAPHVRRGVRVVAPWARSAKTGIVVADACEPPADFPASRIRPIADVLDAAPCVPEQQLALCEWLADYYAAPIGEAVRLAAPPDGGRSASRRLARTGGAADVQVSETARALLDALDSAGGTASPRALIDAVRGARHAHIAELEDAGIVRSVYEVDGGLNVQTIDIVSLRARDDRALGAAQARVVSHLETHGPTTDAELRAEYGTARDVLRTLERRGVVSIETRERIRDPFGGEVERRSVEPPLTTEQERALEAISDAREAAPHTVLLHGVTGRGKTEVYVRATRETITRGKRALILLPEIALTPQFVAVFRQAIESPIAVLHSGLSPGERFDQWRTIREGAVPVVIGARSALLAPLEDIGLIIVDEEHDPSFKQGEGVLYNARDAAILLAHRTGAVCILGSATPSLESLRNAREGRYRLAEMRDRVAGRAMPRFDVVDMAHHGGEPGDELGSWVSPPLAAAVRTAAARGEQSILFLNRRGFAPTVQCTDCGETLRCTDCDISLTYHRARGEVACHYCGFSQRAPSNCPTCRSERLEREGAGTERIADAVTAAFSDLRVGRLDRDTSRGKSLGRVLSAFRRGELDVLVRTQMVTKGHDFPNVTLVGILDADQSLRFPDFRSGERTFQLLTQVAGRAGRGELEGEVVLQTFRPDHFVIDAVARGDFDSFVEREMTFRQRLVYPPFGHLFALRVNGPDHQAAHRLAEQLIGYVRKHGASDLRITGPADAPIARVRGRYRVQALVRGPERRDVRHAVRLVRHAADSMEKAITASDLRWALDVDAVQLL